ncbi:hypothetical protein BB427_17365 [Pseudoalteromonas sp. BMB]|nr:hypothetical protein BB427_17365 [Pseudoalteromonas sp. BMB]
MSMKPTEVGSLSEYISEINSLHTTMDTIHGDLWFRGMNSPDLELKPGIVWRGIDERLENTIIAEFNCNSYPLLEKEPKNSWQRYALMQHYGLPTRLLDWTKSPLVALYFCLLGDNSSDRVVWCIDPFELNKFTVDKETIFTPDTLSEDDGINISSYLPKSLRELQSTSVPALPIAIEPPFTNKRILAQQGCFTVHGTKSDGIEEIFSKNIPGKISLFKIKKELVEELSIQLHEVGIKEDSIYQDLNSLTSRIIREFCNV